MEYFVAKDEAKRSRLTGAVLNSLDTSALPQTESSSISSSPNRRASRGLTIVELIVILAVGLALTAAAFTYYRVMDNKRKLNEEVSFMSTLFIEIQRLYSYQGNYSGLNAAVLANTGIIPQDRVKDGSTPGQKIIVNLFGGEIRPRPYSNTDVSRFTVEYTNIPKQACVDMVMASSNISNLEEIKITAGNTSRTLRKATNNPNEQINVSNASAGCADDNNNTIEITAR